MNFQEKSRRVYRNYGYESEIIGGIPKKILQVSNKRFLEDSVTGFRKESRREFLDESLENVGMHFLK